MAASAAATISSYMTTTINTHLTSSKSIPSLVRVSRLPRVLHAAQQVYQHHTHITPKPRIYSRIFAAVSQEEAPATAVEEAEEVQAVSEEIASESEAVAGGDQEQETVIAPAPQQQNTKLYFGNLPYNCDSSQLAGVVPCGALDVVRIVHLNGLVEEFSCQITAAQILEANPNHVITKPCSTSGGAKRIGIVSPDSELKRGSIYFLIPSSSVPEKKKKKKKEEKKKHPKPTAKVTSSIDDDNYLRELLSEKRSSHRRRRSSVRVAVWRPQLESIKE